MSPRPLARLAPLMRPYTSRLVVAFLFLVVAAAAGLVFPAVLRYLLDAAFELKDRGALDRIALGLLGVFAVQGVANFVQVFLLSSSTERIVATLREQTFAHLIRLSPAFFTERRTGELTSRLSSDLALLQSLLSTWISELSRQTLFLIGGIAMMFVTNPRLTLTTLAVVPVVVIAAFTFGRALRKASTSVQDRIGEAMGMADESFGSIRTVQSFTREGIETQRFSALLHDLVGVAVSRARIRALFFGVVGFVAFGSVAAVLWQGGAQVVARRADVEKRRIHTPAAHASRPLRHHLGEQAPRGFRRHVIGQRTEDAGVHDLHPDEMPRVGRRPGFGHDREQTIVVVAHDAHVAAALRAGAIAGEREEIHLGPHAGVMEGADQVGGKDEAALENRHQQDVGAHRRGDFAGEVTQARGDLLGIEEDGNAGGRHAAARVSRRREEDRAPRS